MTKVTPINCMTCGHRDGRTFQYSKCMLSGYYCSTERTYPTKCGEKFQGWTPRKPGLMATFMMKVFK